MCSGGSRGVSLVAVETPFTLLDLAACRAAVRILAKLRARAHAHCLHHNYDCATSRAGDPYFDVLLKPLYLNLGSATDVSQKFHSVAALRSALWHEFEDAVPDEGEFNVGYFEGKQHTKKWLVTSQDLKAMYSYFQGKPCLSLWCDGSKDQQEDDHEETAPRKKTKKETKRHEREDKLERCFPAIKEEAWERVLWPTTTTLGSHVCCEHT